MRGALRNGNFNPKKNKSIVIGHSLEHLRRCLASKSCSVSSLSRCVVQDCSNSSNPVAGIYLHWSPANKGCKMESFRLLTLEKNFNPEGQFMVCSEHFNEDCFKRLFHMEGNVRRLESGSIPTVW